MYLLIRKIKSISIIFPLSAIVIFLIGQLITINSQDSLTNSMVEHLSIIVYIQFLSSIFYALPTAIVTELIVKKVPEGKKLFKFTCYIFWSILFFFLAFTLLFGMSIFAFIPFLFLFYYEELNFKKMRVPFNVFSIISLIIILLSYISLLFTS
jgi:hypothetical protein